MITTSAADTTTSTIHDNQCSRKRRRLGDASGSCFALNMDIEQFAERTCRYFRRAFFAAFFAFLGDFFFAEALAGFAADFLDVDERPPLKMFSQLSEYCLLAPTRTTLMPNGLQCLSVMM